MGPEPKVFDPGQVGNFFAAQVDSGQPPPSLENFHLKS